MSAMMIPSIYPWISTFVSISRSRNNGFLKPTWVILFILGYITVWSIFSILLLYSNVQIDDIFQETSLNQTDLYYSIFPWVLIGVGAYQLTPLKKSCLKHCRTPLHYFLAQWKNGPRGAFLMGVYHGTFCLGCCWTLMLAMFSLGLMNLVWMIFFTLIVSIENLLPQGEIFAKLIGAIMAIWGITLILGS